VPPAVRERDVVRFEPAVVDLKAMLAVELGPIPRPITAEGPMWDAASGVIWLAGRFCDAAHRSEKIYPSMFRDYLTTGLRVRQQADYGGGVSRKTTERLVHKAAALLAATARQVES
jgi:hypothetical protein